MKETYYSLLEITKTETGYECTQLDVTTIGVGDTAFDAIRDYVNRLDTPCPTSLSHQ